MEIMNASLLLTFWIAGRLECLLLCRNGGGGPSDGVTPRPAPSGRLHAFQIFWTVVVEYNIAWISGNEDYCTGRAASALAGKDELIQFNTLHCGPSTDIIRAGASGKPGSAGERHIGYDIRNSDICETPISWLVTSVYIPISEIWNFDIGYDIWNPDISKTPISQLRAAISVYSDICITDIGGPVISVYPDITNYDIGFARISRSSDIGDTPISCYPISGILRYRRNSETPISELEKSAPISDSISGYTDMGSRAPISEFWRESRCRHSVQKQVAPRIKIGPLLKRQKFKIES